MVDRKTEASSGGQTDGGTSKKHIWLHESKAGVWTESGGGGSGGGETDGGTSKTHPPST